MFRRRKKKQEEMTFMQHLEVLRWHIVRAVISVFVFTAAAFVYKEFIFDTIILLPKTPEFISNQYFCLLAERFEMPSLCINTIPLDIINIDLPGQFKTHIHISIMAGLILSTPYVIWEVWSFIKPALSKKERRYSNGAVIVISLLFFIGVLFSYFIIVPLTINFLGTYQVSEHVTNQINLNSYIRTVTSVTFATGLAFELPVFVYFLSKIGILSPRIMKKNRKYAFVIILILAAIITPPDVFSQFMVLIPIYLLYEMSIWICIRVTKRAAKTKLARNQ